MPGGLQLKTDVRNHRSQQAIARLGAHYEGTLRRYQRRADGTVRDTAMFALLAEDWPAARAGLQQRLDAASAAEGHRTPAVLAPGDDSRAPSLVSARR